MRFSRSERDCRAFTLLEVLMALAIFAFAAIGLLVALQTTLDGSIAIRREVNVRTGLSNRLALLSVGPLRASHDEDVEDGVKYRSEVDREEVTNASRVILRGFWRVRVTAEWTVNGNPQVWTTSHLVYRSDG